MTGMKRTWKMSASAIGAFKACPMRFRLAYVEGLRTIEDTEGQRVGTNWHRLLEVATLKPEEPCICFAAGVGMKFLADENCSICAGRGFVPEDEPLNRAVAWLNAHYATIPNNIDRIDWAVERATLANAVAGWLWKYADDGMDTIKRELAFELPLRHPKTGRALPHVVNVGRIDRIVRYRNRLMLGEYKSTTKDIGPDSSYWERLNLNTQVSHYLCAARDQPGDLTIAGVLWDAWRRPGIKPAKLTQAETKVLMENGIYYDTKFEVMTFPVPNTSGSQIAVEVDGETAEIYPGKKEGTFAIRETPDMYGARLLADICENPDRHFARREIARTDDELIAHQWQMYHIYKTVRAMERDGHWWYDESQCEATFYCPYRSICYHHTDVFDGKTTPPGFRRIYDIETNVTEEE